MGPRTRIQDDPHSGTIHLLQEANAGCLIVELKRFQFHARALTLQFRQLTSRRPDQLQHTLTAEALPAVAETDSGGVFANLPDDIQALADDVDQAQAQKMFDRLSGDLMKKVGGTQATEAAHDLIGGSAPDWNSLGGRRLHAVMRCLTTPDQWRDPTFTTLRDAYQLHRRRQRKPDARLYPGDEDIMQRVPNALDYQPVYAGRDD